MGTLEVIRPTSHFSNEGPIYRPRCVTTKLLLLLLTMAPACARPASPETTLPELSSPQSLAVQERYPHPEVPHRARYHHQLGRHGEDLAPHLLQRAESCPRGAPHPPHRGPAQPQGQQGEDDPDHVRDLQLPGHVRGHPGCPLPVRLRSYHRYCPRLR